ncbi:MAG: PAS domain-containing protein [Ferruginibacter sp.]|nr:PAS domain-containing protein [Ferruginibacter sp.]
MNDISESEKDENAFRSSERRFWGIVKQVPFGIAILRGPEFIVEAANETYLQLVDKSESVFVGRPLFNSLPEVQKSVAGLLNNVLKTGESFQVKEFPVMLKRYGKSELTYFNMTYHPLAEESV